MSDDFGTERNQDEAKTFITQKIVGRNDTGRRIARLILKAAAAGVAFSAAAMLTLLLLLPVLQSRLGCGVEQTEEAVTLARDEAESPSASESADESHAGGSAVPAVSGEGMGADTTQRMAEEISEERDRLLENQEAVTEVVETTVREALKQYSYTMPDILKLNSTLGTVINKADTSVASVTHVREQRDWFDNTLQTAGLYSGIAVAKTETELLILTTAEAVDGADALRVSFQRGAAMDASVKRVDAPTGLAVLSIARQDDNRDLTEGIEPITLGNSYRVRRGDILLALGAPFGKVHSVDYGIASFLTSGISITDGQATVIYASFGSNAASGTWILNTDGELIGWATDAFSGEAEWQTAVLGISDFKAILERMMNGEASALLGIRGTAVITEMQAQGVQEGVYVIEETRNGPGYNAGIQPGDIITRIGDEKITTVRELTSAIERVHAEDLIQIGVMRNGRDSYTAMEFQVTVGAR